MHTQQTPLIYATFVNETAASQALSRLRRLGIEFNEIVVERSSRIVHSGGWSSAIYTRIPEGIAIGFVASPLPSLGLAFLLAKGMPSLLAAGSLIFFGTLVGVCLGAIGGLLYAAFESSLSRNSENKASEQDAEEIVEIAVRCADPSSEDRARRLLAEFPS